MKLSLDYNKHVPRDPIDNAIFRVKLLEACRDNATMQRGVMLACKSDPLFFINCIAEGTLVLTDRGPVPIERISADDLVWDGESWVNQDGCFWQGCTEVIFAYDVYLTPDHKVMTRHGWKDASGGYDRKEVRPPDGYSSRRILSEDKVGVVAVPLRLREDQDHLREFDQGGTFTELRLPPEETSGSRHVSEANLCGVVRDDRPMQEYQKPRLLSLRRQRDQGLQEVAQVRQFLPGYGGSARRTDDRENQQRRKLLQEELPVGHKERAKQQYQEKCVLSDIQGASVDGCNRQNSRHRLSRSARVINRRGQRRRSVGPKQTAKANVYDLLNCGPNRRFTVIDGNGELLLVHNCFGLQYNPNDKISKHGPFVTWDFQDVGIPQIITRWLIIQRDILIEKSRDLGASWSALFIIAWACLFWKGMQLWCISHSEKAVDDPGDPNSLFSKIRFIIDHLPDWMSEGTSSRKLLYKFERTGSTITGAASTGRSGVGGRGPVYLDELGKMTNARSIVGNTADVGPRLYTSTHYATAEGQTFAELCDDASRATLAHEPDLIKIVWHWSMHPEKKKGLYKSYYPAGQKKIGMEDVKYTVLDKGFKYAEGFEFVTNGRPGGPFRGIRSPWYDAECRRRKNPKDVAQHLDIDREGASSMFFEEDVIRELIVNYGKNPVWEGELNYDKVRGTPLSMVKRMGGKFQVWKHPTPYGRFPASKYAIGADISTGAGKTPSCLSIWDAVLCEKVGEYADATIEPFEFAMVAMAVGWLFLDNDLRPALMNWEVNGPGGNFGKRLMDHKYPRIYYRWLEPPAVPYRMRTERPGWHSGGTKGAHAKQTLLENYREALYTRQAINRSQSSLKELASFRWDRDVLIHDKATTADDGTDFGENHADMAIADAVAWLACTELGSGKRGVEEAKFVFEGTNVWNRGFQEALEKYNGGGDDNVPPQLID